MDGDFRTLFWIFSPLLSIGIFCLICLTLSKVSGWEKMARNFRVAQMPKGGSTHRMQSGRIGGVNYNGCLTVSVSPAGIYLAPFAIFRLGHPPILIPFSAIQNAKPIKALMAELVQFEVGDPKITTIRLRKSLFDELRKRRAA